MLKDDKNLDFQNFLDYWSKSKLKDIKKSFKRYKIEVRKLGRKVNNLKLKESVSKLERVYFVNKAIYYKANSNLPYSTLTILGQLLNNNDYHDEVKIIIEQNLIKYNGIFHKLDDQDNQKLIRKVLRTYQFEKINNLKDA
jgi:hypothetical protein